jgi:hypothetical protein
MNGYDNWDLKGKIASFNYVDTYPIEGLVTLSRVAYGGEITHHFTFLEDFEVNDGNIHISRKAGEGSCVDHKNVVSVRENISP